MDLGSDCRRRVVSCARCRKRKIKCDRKTPSCSHCSSAGVQCVGHNSVDGVEVPRSIIAYLEAEIARLDREQADNNGEKHQHVHVDVSNNHWEAGGLFALTEAAQILGRNGNDQWQEENDDAVDGIMRRSELQQMISATMPTGSTPMDLVARVRMGLTPSFILPTYKAGTSPRTTSSIPPRSEGILVESSALASLPSHVVVALVKKYVQRLLPTAPFLLDTDIWKQVDNVLASVGNGTSQSGATGATSVHRIKPTYDHFIVYTVLAISATLGCAKSRHESRCMTFSEILFKEGIQHLSNEAPFPNDLAAVQATLLILQYAEINPKCANVWVLGGAAMRSCLELGLHREPQPNAVDYPDTASLDLRRRIFWMAYCVDRTICSALQRPLSIPDPAINTQPPFLDVKDAVSGGELASKTMDTRPALCLIQLCRLQSVIMDVHYQEKGLDGQAWDDWILATEQLLRRWYEECRSVDGVQAEFGLVHGLVSLHRPSPRMPNPPIPSLMIAFEAACDSARIYREKILYGFVRRPWLAAHHTAESAMVALFSLRYSIEHLVQRFSVGEIFEMMKSFTSNLLHISSQGWSEITKFAARFERLLSPLMDGLLQGVPPSEIIYPPEYDAELNQSLYPGPARLEYLQFGNHQPNVVLMQDNLDPEMGNWDDAFTNIFGSNDAHDWHLDDTLSHDIFLGVHGVGSFDELV